MQIMQPPKTTKISLPVKAPKKRCRFTVHDLHDLHDKNGGFGAFLQKDGGLPCMICMIYMILKMSSCKSCKSCTKLQKTWSRKKDGGLPCMICMICMIYGFPGKPVEQEKHYGQKTRAKNHCLVNGE